ncbi:hypothetical protein CC1G_06554 [Coprinopsis cinerea okayama7|uniref:RING-type domain-containing protein n=1 Tax=Coprinopsis cinerea (strain Okayama-7 / 130 / ATCC MYA-4618 / FGSC 9003) TaxID=240176 RepID=A8N345_COPC7|nr:hypothetical protein CC1G_06554 [Coprinopsis cinerea okayama7\|eukprot:XP_001829217.2 hypothetical protein CC1G_06554 [Coprinopsis cinerea okayama7\
MSSREPLWYCHECNAEMRPLMVPDPVCASCRGSFVEKIENPEDDPRQFAHDVPHDHGGHDHEMGALDLLFSIQSLLDRGINPNPPGSPPRPRPDGSPSNRRLSFQFASRNGTTSVSIGGPPTLGPLGTPPRRESGNAVPTMSGFLRGQPGTERTEGPRTITPQMMAQYLLALLESRDPMAALGIMGPMTGIPSGRMGDYVFNQEALDEIITQLMEQSNAHRPVPATEEIINNLPREVLILGSALLSEDCAVCKEQFKVETEDPEEQIVVKLPCKHPFHQPCIIPWLKSSGTCPVCRYALVPQPNQPTSPRPSAFPTGASGSSSSPGLNSSQSSPSSRDAPSPSPSQESPRPGGGGFLQNLFSHLTGPLSSGSSPSAGSSGTSSPRMSFDGSPRHHRRTSSDMNSSPRGPDNRRRGHDNLPGGWEDDLD